jgi:hypothetical protein
MNDERVKLTRNMRGGTELRVKRLVVGEEGKAWLFNEIHARGLVAADLGKPFYRGSNLIIPIRKEEQ